MRTVCQTACVLLASALADAQPIPYFSATSIQRGTRISHSSATRIIGTFNTSTVSQTTKGIIGVKVQLRHFGKLTSPYEIQCFFIAKDATKLRYVYDFVKAVSDQQFDEVTIFGRDLFAGTETVSKARTSVPSYGISSSGESVYGTSTLTLTQTTIRPGSDIEGWIVRIISEGKVIRSDASLSELRNFAESETADLDKIAGPVLASQPSPSLERLALPAEATAPPATQMTDAQAQEIRKLYPDLWRRDSPLYKRSLEAIRTVSINESEILRGFAMAVCFGERMRRQS